MPRGEVACSGEAAERAAQLSYVPEFARKAGDVILYGYCNSLNQFLQSVYDALFALNFASIGASWPYHLTAVPRPDQGC